MAKLVAFYRPNADEAYQVAVPLLDKTPESLYLAKTIAVAGIDEMVADAMRMDREELARLALARLEPKAD